MIIKFLDWCCWAASMPFVVLNSLTSLAIEILQPELEFKLKTREEWRALGLEGDEDR